MLRWRFAIVIIIFTSAVNLSGQEKNSPGLSKQDRNNQTSPTVEFTFVHNEASKPDAKAADPQSPHWYASAEWWLFILGVPTLAVLGWQANESRRAANAARDAAIVARLSAQAVLDSERPWIAISVESLARNQFIFRATNTGRTPANIVAMWAGVLRIDRGRR